MFFPFEQLPDTSRTWVYQCSRLLTEEEARRLQVAAEKFVTEWTAHQKNLHASCCIKYNYFLIIAVDESGNDASGCSIDKQMHFILETEKEFNIRLLDRMKVAFRNSKNEIETTSLFELSDLLSEGIIMEDTLVFNNLVLTKEELNRSWEIPLKRSWHLQYLEGIKE